MCRRAQHSPVIWTADPCKSFLQVSAPYVLVLGGANDRPPIAIFRLELIQPPAKKCNVHVLMAFK
jgi:hypothetical protein